MNHIQSTDRQLFYSRKDPTDPRMGQYVQGGTFASIEPNSWCIFGYPDDEGVQLNGGRVGAAAGPQKIRHYLYRMTLDLRHIDTPKIFDCGDLKPQDLPLLERHALGRQSCHQVLKGGARWLGLGGGHDYGYADVSGFLSAQKSTSEKPLVINFDSHLDVRSAQVNANSGTAFRRLIEEFNNFDLLEIGIQSHCNSRQHLKWFEDRGGFTLTLDQILQSKLSSREVIWQFLSQHLKKSRAVFISIDIDAFSSAYAPGCSQSWATGLNPNDILPMIDAIAEHSNLQAAGIYEVAPNLDQDDQTAKFAAILAHRIVNQKARS